MPPVVNASQSKACQSIISDIVPEMPTDVVMMIADYLPIQGRQFDIPAPLRFKELKANKRFLECHYCGKKSYINAIKVRLPSTCGEDMEFYMCYRCGTNIEEKLEDGMVNIPRIPRGNGFIQYGNFLMFMTTTHMSQKRFSKFTRRSKYVEFIVNMNVRYIQVGKQFHLDESYPSREFIELSYYFQDFSDPRIDDNSIRVIRMCFGSKIDEMYAAIPRVIP